MECHVRNANFASDARSNVPDAVDDEETFPSGSGARFTPGQFFREAGTIIAVCLGLGMLIQIVLG
jgi:hypothetical protein